jgi:hypothetical protein
MKPFWKLVIAVGLLTFAACTTGQTGQTGQSGQDTGDETATAGSQVDCSTVRCAACPEGQTPALRPPNCCRCVPIDQTIRDCSTVRCAACPEGQRPKLTPPDCCRCVAG